MHSLKTQPKQLEALFKMLYSVTGPAFHLILAVTLLCQTMGGWSNSLRDFNTAVVDPLIIEHVAQMAIAFTLSCDNLLEASRLSHRSPVNTHA